MLDNCSHEASFFEIKVSIQEEPSLQPCLEQSSVGATDNLFYNDIISNKLITATFIKQCFTLFFFLPSFINRQSTLISAYQLRSEGRAALRMPTIVLKSPFLSFSGCCNQALQYSKLILECVLLFAVSAYQSNNCSDSGLDLSVCR